MKTTILAATLALTTAGAASAQDYTVFGTAEYAVEADTFEIGVGADIYVGDFTFTPALYADRVADENDLNRAELTVAYQINGNWAAYATVETDRDWDYAETTFGTRVEF